MEILQEFVFGRAEMDYAILFDGKIRRVVQGVDFATTPRSLAIRLCAAARKRGIKIHTHQEKNAVVFQAILPEANGKKHK